VDGRAEKIGFDAGNFAGLFYYDYPKDNLKKLTGQSPNAKSERMMTM
jgi:hypothetical protein